MEKEKNKFHVTHYTVCQNDKSYEAVKRNLPSEHKQMQKFTKVENGERETYFMSLTTLFVRMIKVMK